MANRYWVGGNGTWDNISGLHWSNTASGNSGFSPPGPGDNVFLQSGEINLIYSPTIANITRGASGNLIMTNQILTITGTSELNLGTSYYIKFGPDGKIVFKPPAGNANVTIDTGFIGVNMTGSGMVVIDTTDQTANNVTIATQFLQVGTNVRGLDCTVIGNSSEVTFDPDGFVRNVFSDQFTGNLGKPGYYQTLLTFEGDFHVGANVRAVNGELFRANVSAGKTQSLTTNGVPWLVNLEVRCEGTFNFNDDINPNWDPTWPSYMNMGKFSTISCVSGTVNFNAKTFNVLQFNVLNGGTSTARKYLTLNNSGSTVNIFGTNLVTDFTASVWYIYANMLTIQERIRLNLISYNGYTQNFQITTDRRDTVPFLENQAPDLYFIGNPANATAQGALSKFTVDSFFNDLTIQANVPVRLQFANTSVYGNIITNEKTMIAAGTPGGGNPQLEFCSQAPKVQYLDAKDHDLYLDLVANVANGKLSVIGGVRSVKTMLHLSGEFFLDTSTSTYIDAVNYTAPPGNNYRVFDMAKATLELIGNTSLDTEFTFWQSYGCDNYLSNSPESTVLLTGTSLLNQRTLYFTAGDNQAFGNIVVRPPNVFAQLRTLNFNGNITIVGSLIGNASGNYTIQFTSGTLTTLNGWNVVGNSTTRIGISSNGISQHYLNIQSGSIVSDNVRISLSNASSNVPGLEWYAGNNSIDGGQNDGWVFANIPPPPPHTGDAFFIMDNP